MKYEIKENGHIVLYVENWETACKYYGKQWNWDNIDYWYEYLKNELTPNK